jgi:hypothetical protein
MPVVSLVTAHGRQALSGGQDERVADLLARHGVPWSAVSIYAVGRDGAPPALRPCLDARLRELDDVAELLVYFNRNVNPFAFALGGLAVADSAEPGAAATEYVYQQLDNERGAAQALLKKLSPAECREAVAAQVGETLRAHVPAGADLVVGVSGGGDSNALLHGLGALGEGHELRIHPLIVKGIPDWDAGVPRAQELCDAYGLELTIVEEADVKALLGIPPDDGIALIDRFEREFGGDDFEFLGTLLIRLALSAHARALGTEWICTGLNLEDVLCEGVYRIASGLAPAPIPARRIGDVTLVMPLWLCPKRIVDGCFPRWSLENYDARYPCVSLGRNLYYSVVWALQSQFPAVPEQLAHGLAELAARDPVEYRLDEQLGFHVERFVPFPLRRRFERMRGAGVAAG